MKSLTDIIKEESAKFETKTPSAVKKSLEKQGVRVKTITRIDITRIDKVKKMNTTEVKGYQIIKTTGGYDQIVPFWVCMIQR